MNDGPRANPHPSPLPEYRAREIVRRERRFNFWSLQQRFAPYLFISPFIILFIVFMLYPLGRSIMLSLYQTAGRTQRKFVGLENYYFLLRDQYFWMAVLNTGILTAAFVAIQIPLAMGMAILVNAKVVRWKNFFRFAFFSTHLVGSVFAAVLFSQLLNPRQGLVNRAIGLLIGHNPQIPWLTDPILGRVSILVAWLWLSIGWGMIYFLAALQSVDQGLYEAASVDGAGKLGQFWHITLPGIRPVTVFMLLVGTIGGFQLFEIPYVLYPTGNGPNRAAVTIVSYLFTTGWAGGDLGYAAAIGWMLVLIILTISLLQYRFTMRGQSHV
jgi:ABC-type sugar transport system permease subunit